MKIQVNLLQIINVFFQGTVERFAAQGGGGANDEKFHPSARRRNVHASEIVQKTYISLFIAPHKRNNNNIPFLPLEAIDSINAYEISEWFEKWFSFKEMAKILNLGAIGRNNPYV